MKNVLAKFKPLTRQNNLSINTVEGWKDYIRVENSKDLIERGIEPTEANLEKYQLEVNALVEELKKKHPPEILPIHYINKRGGQRLEAQ